MDYDAVTIDGVETPIRATTRDGKTYADLNAFCLATGSELKPLPGGDQLSVCRGDLCIPLADGDLIEVDGVDYVDLGQVGAAPPGELAWRRGCGRNGQAELRAGCRRPSPSVHVARSLDGRAGSVVRLRRQTNGLLHVGVLVRMSWPAARVAAILSNVWRSCRDRGHRSGRAGRRRCSPVGDTGGGNVSCPVGSTESDWKGL